MWGIYTRDALPTLLTLPEARRRGGLGVTGEHTFTMTPKDPVMLARAARALVASMLLSVLSVRVQAECQPCTLDNAHSGHWYVLATVKVGGRGFGHVELDDFGVTGSRRLCVTGRKSFEYMIS
jgi:hypothetical protein